MKKQITCNCPAYEFRHSQGGGKCNLPGFCDLFETWYCEDDCTFMDDCPIIDEIRASIDQYWQPIGDYDTLEEKYLAEME